MLVGGDGLASAGRMMAALGTRWRSAAGWRRLLLILLAVQIGGGSSINLRASLLRLVAARGRWAETWSEARRRSLEPAYVRGLEQVEAAIPPTGSYLLVDRTKDGTFALLQGDLAPRRAWRVQEEDLDRLRRRRRRRRSPELPELVVLFDGVATAPRCLPRERFLAEGAPPRGVTP